MENIGKLDRNHRIMEENLKKIYISSEFLSFQNYFRNFFNSFEIFAEFPTNFIKFLRLFRFFYNFSEIISFLFCYLQVFQKISLKLSKISTSMFQKFVRRVFPIVFLRSFSLFHVGGILKIEGPISV